MTLIFYYISSKSAGCFTFLSPIITNLRRISASFSLVLCMRVLILFSVSESSLVDQVFTTNTHHLFNQIFHLEYKSYFKQNAYINLVLIIYTGAPKMKKDKCVIDRNEVDGKSTISRSFNPGRSTILWHIFV